MKLKTNMILTISVFNEELLAKHKTGHINVTDLLKIGNKQRTINGLQPMTAPQLKRNKHLKEFIISVEKQIQAGQYDNFDTSNSVIYVAGVGNKAKTWAFLPIALKMASLLSTDFEAELYRIFINDSLLQLRDDGGNNFKRLNRSIDLYLGGREDKKSNRGCYIQSAKLLRDKIFPRLQVVDGNIWNTDQATAHHQELRKLYEDKLCILLEMGVVKDFEHLKTFIAKL
jgi:hypothetical protein